MSMFPRFTSSAISRRAAGADSISRLALTESIATSGRLAGYRRNSYTVESVIHGISTLPDFPPCVTSLSSSVPVETRTSAPAGSFVSHEMTHCCPKQSGVGFALIVPVICLVPSVLVTAANHGQLVTATTSSWSVTGDDCSKLLKCSSLKRNCSLWRAASGE